MGCWLPRLPYGSETLGLLHTEWCLCIQIGAAFRWVSSTVLMAWWELEGTDSSRLHSQVRSVGAWTGNFAFSPSMQRCYSMTAKMKDERSQNRCWDEQAHSTQTEICSCGKRDKINPLSAIHVCHTKGHFKKNRSDLKSILWPNNVHNVQCYPCWLPLMSWSQTHPFAAFLGVVSPVVLRRPLPGKYHSFFLGILLLFWRCVWSWQTF